jgi:aspartate dehydrogenase
MKGDRLAVGVIGYGAIGKVVADELHRGSVPGADLAGVCTRGATETVAGHSTPFEETLERSQLLVECAGHEAVSRLGPTALRAGRDLLISSLGALTDDDVLADLREAGPGRLLLSTGAIGGIDLLRAAERAGPVQRVRLVTTKPPAALVQDWMEHDYAELLRNAREPVVVFDGRAREATAKFPRTANVAAALAFAAGGWQCVEVTIIADPASERSGHDIECDSAMGEYRFTIRNRPSPDNPATSAVVPHALLRAIADEASAGPWRFQ